MEQERRLAWNLQQLGFVRFRGDRRFPLPLSGIREKGRYLMQIWLRECEVVGVDLFEIMIHFGQGVVIHIPTKLFSHRVKLGEKLPLFTEIPNASLK